MVDMKRKVRGNRWRRRKMKNQKRRKFTDAVIQTSMQFLILITVQMEKVLSERRKIGNAALNTYSS
jgi:hypothetical protein